MAKHSELSRRKPGRVVKPRWLIVCEGAKTEQEYFHGLRKALGNKVILEFDARHSDPKSIVEVAAAAKRNAARAARQDPNEEFDQIWCVFDRDTHPLVQEALCQAEANSLPVAFSDPCFELWLLLHFQNQTAHITAETACSLCGTYMPQYEKSPQLARLLEGLESAETRAAALNLRQARNGMTRQNPWTEVHKLVSAIRNVSAA
jgi:hypothetical protein